MPQSVCIYRRSQTSKGVLFVDVALKSEIRYIYTDCPIIIMSIYRMIQEKSSIFWEVIVSVIARNIYSFEHVSNCELLSR